jgi:hypothetical protein
VKNERRQYFLYLKSFKILKKYTVFRKADNKYIKVQKLMMITFLLEVTPGNMLPPSSGWNPLPFLKNLSDNLLDYMA